jgi:hypothetical protein
VMSKGLLRAHKVAAGKGHNMMGINTLAIYLMINLGSAIEGLLMR